MLVDQDSRGRDRHDFEAEYADPHVSSCRVCGLGERNEIHAGRRIRMVTGSPESLVAILDLSAGDDLRTNDRYLRLREAYAEQLGREAR